MVMFILYPKIALFQCNYLQYKKLVGAAEYKNYIFKQNQTNYFKNYQVFNHFLKTRNA